MILWLFCNYVSYNLKYMMNKIYLNNLGRKVSLVLVYCDVYTRDLQQLILLNSISYDYIVRILN